jgi:hypothetical protein
VLEPTAIRGVTRRYRQDLDLPRLQGQFRDKFAGLLGEHCFREAEGSALGFGRLVKAECWEPLALGWLCRPCGYAPMAEWREREELERLGRLTV